MLDDLARDGQPFDPAWFAPHLEFRFPEIGGFNCRGMQVELRHALEPWHVLGEEPSGGGTVRYVDASLERVQIKLEGMTTERFVVACNGRAVPLRATGVAGTYVAGVRFKAWAPASALHPTVPVHAPLTFDVLRQLERAVAGRLHLPRGPSRRPQFRAFSGQCQRGRGAPARALLRPGHTPGAMPAPMSFASVEMPLTLDFAWGEPTRVAWRSPPSP